MRAAAEIWATRREQFNAGFYRFSHQASQRSKRGMTIQYMAKTINIVRTIILTMKGSAVSKGKRKATARDASGKIPIQVTTAIRQRAGCF
jgi:hypothetical protein